MAKLLNADAHFRWILSNLIGIGTGYDFGPFQAPNFLCPLWNTKLYQNQLVALPPVIEQGRYDTISREGLRYLPLGGFALGAQTPVVDSVLLQHLQQDPHKRLGQVLGFAGGIDSPDSSPVSVKHKQPKRRIFSTRDQIEVKSQIWINVQRKLLFAICDHQFENSADLRKYLTENLTGEERGLISQKLTDLKQRRAERKMDAHRRKPRALPWHELAKDEAEKSIFAQGPNETFQVDDQRILRDFARTKVKMVQDGGPNRPLFLVRSSNEDDLIENVTRLMKKIGNEPGLTELLYWMNPDKLDADILETTVSYEPTPGELAAAQNFLNETESKADGGVVGGRDPTSQLHLVDRYILAVLNMPFLRETMAGEKFLRDLNFNIEIRRGAAVTVLLAIEECVKSQTLTENVFRVLDNTFNHYDQSLPTVLGKLLIIPTKDLSVFSYLITNFRETGQMSEINGGRLSTRLEKECSKLLALETDDLARNGSLVEGLIENLDALADEYQRVMGNLRKIEALGNSTPGLRRLIDDVSGRRSDLEELMLIKDRLKDVRKCLRGQMVASRLIDGVADEIVVLKAFVTALMEKDYEKSAGKSTLLRA